MMRITYVGAAFLCIIAVVPTVVNHAHWTSRSRSPQFLGGTGLLIVVSVALDMVQRIEANLLMRNYGGFLGTAKKAAGVRRWLDRVSRLWVPRLSETGERVWLFQSRRPERSQRCDPPGVLLGRWSKRSPVRAAWA